MITRKTKYKINLNTTLYLLLNFILINLQTGGAINIVVITESNTETTEFDTSKKHAANKTNIQEITFNNTIF